MTDKTLGAYTRHEKHDAVDRIEQAADRLIAFMQCDQSPATADHSVTDEMVNRGYDALVEANAARVSAPKIVRMILAAAIPLAPVRECPDPERRDFSVGANPLAAYWMHKYDQRDAMAALWKETAREVFKARKRWRGMVRQAEYERDRAYMRNGYNVLRAEKAEKSAALWKEVAREHVRRRAAERLHHDVTQDALGSAIRSRRQAEEERDEARAAEPRTLTARGHLNAAWEAAHVPADGVIPAGTEYLYRLGGERVVQGGGVPFDREASEDGVERRLLDAPEPKRPDGAEAIADLLTEYATGHPGGSDWERVADFLASRGVRVEGAER